jgi:hypothetical protein
VTATIGDCRRIDLPRVTRREGNLTAVHGGVEVPFPIERVFYVYDVPGGEGRGAHAHKTLHQFIVSILGAFEVTVDDGVNRRTETLNRAYYGLYVPPGIWCELAGFSSGAVCLVLASDHYEESDYIRDHDQYVRYKRSDPVS